jgi:hypothetical protein
MTMNPTFSLISRLATMIAGATIAGCSLVYGGDIDARQCTSSADCEAAAATLGDPLVCLASICQRQTCTTNAECPAQTVCSNTVCVKGDAGPMQRACTQDSECGAGERCGYDKLCYDKWGCLDTERDWTPNASATFRSAVGDFITGAVATGNVTVRACRVNDPDCSRPVVEVEQVPVEAATKAFTVTFSALTSLGFIGMVNVTASGTDGLGAPFLPGYVHFTQETPLVSDLKPQTDVLLIGSSSIATLAASWAYPIDPQKVILVLQAHDCGGRRAPGVSLAPLDAVADYLYVPIAGKMVPMPGETKTADDGAALAFNLPGKSQVFIIRDEDLSRVLTDKISVTLRAPGINYLAYYPRRSAVEKYMAYAKSQGLVP